MDKDGASDLMTGDETSLAATFNRLIQSQRLSYAHIARIAHLSRNTVKLIADGKTRQPTAETLCRIAVGLGADPYTRRVHQETMVMALRELGEAAGYGDLKDGWITDVLPVLLATITGDVERASAWLQVIADYAGVEPERVRALLERATERRSST